MTPPRDTYGPSMLNLIERRFWCEDLGEGVIEDLLDDEGELTDEPALAVVAIVKISPAIWLNIRVRDYAPQPRN